MIKTLFKVKFQHEFDIRFSRSIIVLDQLYQLHAVHMYRVLDIHNNYYGKVKILQNNNITTHNVHTYWVPVLVHMQIKCHSY